MLNNYERDGLLSHHFFMGNLLICNVSVGSLVPSFVQGLSFGSKNFVRLT